MNSDVIRLLPDSVANQIAAGEVIQRPASVVKELVENAIDAGATAITIVVKDAGRTLIQVIDNGCGMSPTDARMAFERHATSKISSASDLYSLHTMGFRGEALASIAAVAQIDMRTMRRDDKIGTRLTVSESRFEAQEPVVCAPGTNLMVKNLFFHTPGRRRFLKKDSVELSHIMHEFERMALVNTTVEFTMIHNDTTLHKFMSGTFKQRIGSLFGKNLESQLAPVGTDTSLVKISGFVGMPRFAKKRGAPQFLFVNGRHMRHPLFHKAIVKCYEQLIAADTQPSYFVNFEVEPDTIDVNIHPQKHEIKFEHEQAIFQILEAAVRESLGKTQAAGALDFDASQSPDIPLFQPDSEAMPPDESFDDSFNPFTSADSGSLPTPSPAFNDSGLRPSGYSGGQVSRNWDKLYEEFTKKRDSSISGLIVSSSNPDSHDDDPIQPAGFYESRDIRDSDICFQLGHKYIAAPSPEGLMIIHQRRAHIRIEYERIMDLIADSTMESQSLIFAEDIELPSSQSSLLQGVDKELASLGFRIRHNAGLRWSIEAVPAILKNISPSEALQAILDNLSSENSSRDNLKQSVALALARQTAVSANQDLSQSEVSSIFRGLAQCNTPAHTPDGLSTFVVIDSSEIDRRLQ